MEILKGSGSTFSVRMVGLVAGYVLVLMISRIYGAEVLGAYTLSTTILMIFTIPGRLGLDLGIVKNFAKDHAAKRWDRILEYYYKTLGIVIPAGVILSILLFFSAEHIAVYVFKKPSLTIYFQVIAFAVLPMIVRFINSETYRGFGQNKEYAYSLNAGYLIYASVILGILSLYFKHPWFPNLALTASLVILAFSGTYRITKKIKKYTPGPSTDLLKLNMLRESTPMMLVSSLLLLSGWINTIILGIYASQSEVGIYSVIIKISTLSSFILMAVNSVAAPRFAQLHAAGDEEGLRHYLNNTAALIFYTSIPLFLAIIIFRTWILGFFGEEFETGATALIIAIGGQLFNVFAGSVGQFMNMTGKQVVFRNIILFSTFINIIACAILIPAYGIIGSALAGMLFMASWNLIAMVYIRKKWNLRTYYWPFSNK